MSNAFRRMLRRARLVVAISLAVGAVAGSEQAQAAVCADFNGLNIFEQDGNVVTFLQRSDTIGIDPGESLTFTIAALGGGGTNYLLEINNVAQIAPPGTVFTLLHPGGQGTVNFAFNVFLHEARLTVTGICGPFPVTQDTGSPVPTDRIFFSHQGFAATAPFFDGIPGMNPESLPYSTGVYVALGDLDGDGNDEIITAPSPGLGVSGRNGDDKIVVDPGLPPLLGGVRVVVADLDGDGTDGLVIGSSPGAGGPRVAVADLTGDGIADVVVDPGTSPLTAGVRVFLADLNGDGNNGVVVRQGGLYVAAADVNGDGFSDVVVDPGVPPLEGGVRVAAGDLNGDGIADIIFRTPTGRFRVIATYIDGEVVADSITIDGSGGLMRYAQDRPVGAGAWESLPADRTIGGLPDFISEHHTTLGGLPVNLWGRLKGTVLDGRLGRSGAVGAVQLGLTVGVTPSIDVGIVGHLTGGEIKSSALSSDVDSVAGGIGAYVMSRLKNGMRLGVSTSHSWGSHDLVLNGVTGEYGSSYWTIDGSAAMPFRFGGVVLTPMALATWRQISLGAYTASNGLAIPAYSDSTFALSGAIDLAYPIAMDGPVITTLTPRVNVRTNVYLKKAETLVLGPGITLESSAMTVDIAAGLAAAFANGGGADLLLGVNGLAGDVQSYSIRFGLRMPLN